MVTKGAFLFPGQGSQYVGMGKAAASRNAKAASLLEQGEDILGFRLSEILFNGPEDKLKETSITQPALFVTSAMALEEIKELGLTPDYVAGHSLGEYSALYAAGAFNFETALKLVHARGKAMQEAGRQSDGAMAAILGLESEKIKLICNDVSQSSGVCVMANYNSESQIVISGTKNAVKIAGDKAKELGAIKVIPLIVSGAFHSPLMKPAAEVMKQMIEQANVQEISIPIISNVDAELTTSPSEIKSKLIRQIDNSVLWHSSLKKLISLNVEQYIEVGAGKVLSTMVKKLDRKKPVFMTDDLDSLKQSLASNP